MHYRERSRLERQMWPPKSRIENAPPGVPTRTPSAGPGDPAPSTGPLHRVPDRRYSDSPRPIMGPAIFPRRLFERPSSVLVYGPSRPLVNLTLYALAHHTNPEFHWVEVGAIPQPPTVSEPVQLGWIPDSRLWLVDRSNTLRPNDAAAALPLGELISPDEPPESLRQFVDFLRLPDQAQRLIAAQTPNGSPGVVAVPDTDRLEGTFSASEVDSLLAVHREAGLSVMVGHRGSPGSGRDVFDFVFRLQGRDERPDGWKKNQLVCEKGITSGPLRDLQPIHLEYVPILFEVISKARPIPW